MNTIVFWHVLRLARNPLHVVVMVCAMYAVAIVTMFAWAIPGVAGAVLISGLALGFAAPGSTSVPNEAAYLLSRPLGRASCLSSWMFVALIGLGLVFCFNTLLLGQPSLLSGEQLVMAMDKASEAVLTSAGFTRVHMDKAASQPEIHAYALPGYRSPVFGMLVLSVLWGMLVRFGLIGSVVSFSRWSRARFLISGAPALVAVAAWIGLVFAGRASPVMTWGYLHPQYIFSALGVGIALSACRCTLVWLRGDVA